jgi:hypothetical protein
MVRTEISAAVQEALRTTPVIDMHTHLFMPSLGTLGLWGIDQLLTYHYLEAELFRSSKVIPEQYWELSLREKAGLIWNTLFFRNTPIRSYQGRNRCSRCVRTADGCSGFIGSTRVSEVVMTNDPLDPAEGLLWEQGVERDPRFHPVLRLDRILNQFGNQSILEVRRFLSVWIDRMNSRMAAPRSRAPGVP